MNDVSPSKSNEGVPFFSALLKLEKSIRAIQDEKQRTAALRFARDRIQLLGGGPQAPAGAAPVAVAASEDALRQWERMTLEELVATQGAES